MSLVEEITQLKNALARLEEALTAEHTQLNQDAAIQRFEFTFELLWKTIKVYATKYGRETASPRDAFRLAADLGIIENPEPYFKFLDARNLASHTYSEDQAGQVYEKIKEFPSAVKAVLRSMSPKSFLQLARQRQSLRRRLPLKPSQRL